MRPISPQTFEMIEYLASQAWPAAEQRDAGRWVLRRDPGVTSRRCNSVLAVGPYPDPDWLEAAIRFYSLRGQPCRFHVGTASPPDLDERLERAGFRLDTPCSLWTAELPLPDAAGNVPAASARGRPDGHAGTASAFAGGSPAVPVRTAASCGSGADGRDLRLAPAPDRDWMDVWLRLEGHDPALRDGFSALMRRIAPPTQYASVRADGRIVGIASAAAQGEWAGLFNVAVDPDYRRQGLAERLIRALADWSAAQGCRRMYLQVVAGNGPALNLYRKLGFRPLYDFHYRVKP